MLQECKEEEVEMMIPKTMQKTELNITTSYKRYSKEAIEPVSISTYLAIANGYMKFLMAKVLNGEEVTLPARLGTLFIEGTKKKLAYNKDGIPMLPPNWAKTKELWERNPEAKLNKKIVYCLNEETNGITYKIHWSRNRVAIDNKEYYALRFTRDNKRATHRSIKSGKEYIIKNK